MDFLQIALIFLIALLSIFLTITGVQVFFILRDLKKSLDKFNNMLESGQQIAKDIERPVTAAANLVAGVEAGVKAIQTLAQDKPKSPSKPKFYKKIMK
jgi:hypothetical protein